jgi:N2-acetyl-L-2,4-diaminobutanoate deacetylase
VAAAKSREKGVAGRSTVHTEIDYDRDGRQVGHLYLPQSPHEDAWGAIPIPIAVIKNGSGPTVLITGGNHGDEHEGPITIGRLIRELEPGRIQGRLIMIPALNAPASLAGRRTSPIDGRNFNRCFPGNPEGTATEQIAFYVHDVLFPLADAFMDLHSGGSSLQILPSAAIEPSPDPEQMRRIVDAVRAFDAPYTVAIDNLGDPRTSTASAMRAGLTVVGTELTGGGGVSREGLRVCERGVRNVLAHLGVLEGEPAAAPDPDRPIFRIPGPPGYVLAPADGVFEAFHELGEPVEAGQPAGAVHFLDDPGRPPEPAHFRHSGMLYAKRTFGRVERGNCVAVVVSEYAPL